MRAEEAHQPEPLGGGDRDLGQGDRLVEPAGGIEQPHEVRVGAPDVVDDPERLGDAERGAEVLEPLLDLAADASAESSRVERVPFDLARPEVVGERPGLVGEGGRLGEPAAEHEHLGVAGHGSGARFARRVRRGEPRRAAVRLPGELALPRDPGVAAETLVQQPGPDRVGCLVDEADRGLDVRHRPARLVEAGHAGELGEQVHAIAAGPRLGVGDVVPQLDRALVLRLRLGEGVARRVGIAGRDRRLERARQVVGREPVVGELGRAPGIAPGARLEGPGEGRVQPGPLTGQEVVVDRLLEERVAECVALDPGRRVGDEDLPADAFAERLVEGRLVERRGGREEGRIDPLAGRRRHPQELLGRLGQVGRARQQHVAERVRQLGPAILARRHEELLAEERVAAGPDVDRIDECRVEVVPGDRAQLLGRFAPVERLEGQPLDAARPFELGQERQQRMTSMELVGAVREHEHDRGIAQVADEEAEQVARRAVGPVEVLHDEHDRRPGGHPLQEAEEQLEQTALARAVAQPGGRPLGHRAEVRHQPGQLGPAVAEDQVELVRVRPPDEPTQRLRDRRVGHRTFAQVDAAAEQDDGTLGLRDRRQLGDEPRLADTGLAGEEDRAAAALVRGLQGSP